MPMCDTCNVARAAKYELRSFKAISNGALDSKELPKSIKILSWGSNETNDGEVSVTKETLKVFQANQKKIGRVRIPIDFNHNTVPGTQAYESDKEPRLVAGYGSPVVKEGDGLYIEEIVWTPTGEKCAREFEDLSPAPLIKDGVVIGLHSCALTHAGAVTDLTFYSACESVADVVNKMSTFAADNHSKLESKNAELMTMNANITAMRTFLKLPETSDDNAVLEAAVAHFKTPPPTPEPVKTLSADDIKNVVSEAIKPLSATISAIETKATEAKAAAEKSERDALIAEASKDGKVIPLSAEACSKLDIPTLKEMISKLTKDTVPTVKRAIKPLSADEQKQHLEGARDRAAAAISESVRPFMFQN